MATNPFEQRQKGQVVPGAFKLPPPKDEKSAEFRNFAEHVTSTVPPEVKQEKDVGFWTRVFGYLQRGQYISANIAMELKRGNWEVWEPLVLEAHGRAIAEGFTGKRRGNFGELIEETQWLKDLGIRNTPGKLDAADVLGFLGDVFLDPTTYLGIGVLSKGGKTAQATTATLKAARATRSVAPELAEAALKGSDEAIAQILKIEDATGPLADRVKRMLAEKRGSELIFGRTLAEQAAKGQRHLLAFERPAFRKSASGLYLPEINVAKVGDFPFAQRLPKAIQNMPALVAPATENFVAVPIPRALQVLTFQGAGVVGGLARTTPGVSRVVNTLGKALVPYYRPVGQDPELWERFVEEMRAFQTGATSGQANVFDKIREVGLRDDGIIAQMFRVPLADEDQVLLRKAVESPWLLRGGEIEAADVVLQRVLRGVDVTDADDILRMANENPEAAARATELLELRAEKLTEAMQLYTSGTRKMDPTDFEQLSVDLEKTQQRLAELRGEGPGTDVPPAPDQPPPTPAGPPPTPAEPPPGTPLPPQGPPETPPPPLRPAPKPPRESAELPKAKPPKAVPNPRAESRYIEELDALVRAHLQWPNNVGADVAGLDSAIAKIDPEFLPELLKRTGTANTDELAAMIRKLSGRNRRLVNPTSIDVNVPKVDTDAPGTPWGNIEQTKLARGSLIDRYRMFWERRLQAMQGMARRGALPTDPIWKNIAEVEDEMERLIFQIDAVDNALATSSQLSSTQKAVDERIAREISDLQLSDMMSKPAHQTNLQAFNELEELKRQRRQAFMNEDVDSVRILDQEIRIRSSEDMLDRIRRLHPDDPNISKILRDAEDDIYKQSLQVYQQRYASLKKSAAQALEAEPTGQRILIEGTLNAGEPAGKEVAGWETFKILNDEQHGQRFVIERYVDGDYAGPLNRHRTLDEALRDVAERGGDITDVQIGLTTEDRFGVDALMKLAQAQDAVPYSKALEDVVGDFVKDGKMAKWATRYTEDRFVEELRSIMRQDAPPELLDEKNMRDFYRALREQMGLDPRGDIATSLAEFGGNADQILADVAEAISRHRTNIVGELGGGMDYEPLELDFVGPWTIGQTEGPLQIAYHYRGELNPTELRMMLEDVGGRVLDQFDTFEIIPYKLPEGMSKEQFLAHLTPGGVQRPAPKGQLEAFPGLVPERGKEPMVLRPAEGAKPAPEVENTAAHSFEFEQPAVPQDPQLPPADFQYYEISHWSRATRVRKEQLAALREELESGYNRMGVPYTDEERRSGDKMIKALELIIERNGKWVKANLGEEAYKQYLARMDLPRENIQMFPEPKNPPDGATLDKQLDLELDSLQASLISAMEIRKAWEAQGFRGREVHKLMMPFYNATLADLNRIAVDYAGVTGRRRVQLEELVGHIKNEFPEIDILKAGHGHTLLDYTRSPRNPIAPHNPKPGKRKGKPPRKAKQSSVPAPAPETYDGDFIIDELKWPLGTDKLRSISRDTLHELPEEVEPYLHAFRSYDDTHSMWQDKVVDRAQVIARYRAVRDMARGKRVRGADAPNVEMIVRSSGEKGVNLSPNIYHAEFFPTTGTLEITDTAGRVYQFEFKFKAPLDIDSSAASRAVGTFSGLPSYPQAIQKFISDNLNEPIMKAVRDWRMVKRWRAADTPMNYELSDNMMSWADFEKRHSMFSEGFTEAQIEKELRSRLAAFLKENPIDRVHKGRTSKVKLRVDDVLGKPYRDPEYLRKRYKVPKFGKGWIVRSQGRHGIVIDVDTPKKGMRTVEFEDGTKLTASVDDLEYMDLREAADNGESLIDFFRRKMGDNSGMIDFDGMQRFMTRMFKRDPLIRRQVATEITDEIIRLRPELAPRASLMVEIFDNWAMNEQSRGILKGFIDFYFPHARWENSRFKWLLGRGPLRRRREFYEFMRTIEGTIDEINAQARAAGKVDPVFHEKTLLAMAIRGVASERAVRTFDFIENLADQFGHKVTSTTANNFDNITEFMRKTGVDEAVIQRATEIDERIKTIIGEMQGNANRGQNPKPLTTKERVEAGKQILKRGDRSLTQELHQLEAELEQLVPDVGLYLPYGEFRRFPVKAIPGDALEEGILTQDEMLAAMSVLQGMTVKEGDYLVMIPLSKIRDLQAISRHVNGYLLPMNMADQVNSTIRNHTIIGEDLRPWLQLFDAGNSWFKKWTLSIFPTYHFRNSVSDTVNMLHGGFDTPANWGASWRFLSRDLPNVEFKGITDGWGRLHTPEQLVEDMQELGVLNRGFFATEVEKTLESEIGAPKFALPLFGGDQNVLLRAGQMFGNLSENHRRVAMYFDGLQKGLPPRAAAMRVKQYLFDFGDLTPFERATLRRLFPFYSWTRKNLPLQMKALLTRPGKFVALHKAAESAERGVFADPPDEKDLPPWMGDMLPVPIVRNPDNTVSYFLTGGWLPQADLLKTYDIPALAGGLLTPLIKAPIEFMINYSLYFGDKVEKYPKETGEFLGINIRKRYINLLRNLRVLSTMDRLIFDKDLPLKQRVANLLVGRLYPVDFERTRDFRGYQVSRDLSTFRRALKKEEEKLAILKEQGRLITNEDKVNWYRKKIAELEAEQETLGKPKKKSKIRAADEPAGPSPLKEVPKENNPRSREGGGFGGRAARPVDER